MIGGLQPNVQYQRVDGGQTDMALGQITTPLNNVLTALNTAFSGTVNNPTLNSQNLTSFSRVSFADRSLLFVSNGYLNFQNATGNVIRLGAAGAASSPTGPITLSQIPAGSSGQVLTTVGSSVSWATPSGGGTTYTVFNASGTGHSSGLVPDPGGTAGTGRYLREDATWVTVPAGATGATGPAGPTGPTGATGATGSTGAAGSNGTNGTNGTNGNTIISGTTTPPPSGTGVNGDYYYNTSTTTIWGPKASGSWPGSGTSLVGPQGPTGPAGSGGGTVTSIAVTVPSDLSVSPSGAITTSGTFAITRNTQSPNTFLAGPASGAAATPAYRAIVVADIPTLPASQIGSGTFAAARIPVMVASGASAASGAVPTPPSTAGTAKYLREDGTWVVPSGGAAGLQAGMEGVLFTSTQTWAASGVSNSITATSTYNGNTVTRYVITKIAITLVSGTPGTSATFGMYIGSFTCFSARQLPTYSGGVDVTIVDINVQNINGTSKNAQPGDILKTTSGGTFTTSCSWRIDWIGYYY